MVSRVARGDGDDAAATPPRRRRRRRHTAAAATACAVVAKRAARETVVRARRPPLVPALISRATTVTRASGRCYDRGLVATLPGEIRREINRFSSDQRVPPTRPTNASESGRRYDVTPTDYLDDDDPFRAGRPVIVSHSYIYARTIKRFFYDARPAIGFPRETVKIYGIIRPGVINSVPRKYIWYFVRLSI